MHIFISYSRGTPYIAETIKLFLEDKEFKVWIDLEGIPGGAKWAQAIMDAIENSFLVLVVVTKQALDSEWILKELQEAKKQNRQILPLLLERVDDVETALEKLEISDLQIINFVTTRRNVANSNLLSEVENAYRKWSKVVPHIQNLNSNDTHEIINGIRQLAKVRGDPSIAIQQLRIFLKHDDDDIRAEAVKSICAIGDESVVIDLIKFIKSGHFISDYSGYEYNPVEEAIETLGEIGGKIAIQFLRSEIERCVASGEHFGDELISLGKSRDLDSINFMCKLLANKLDSEFTDLGDFFDYIYALGISNNNACVPHLSKFIERSMSLIQAGFDNEDFEAFGEIEEYLDSVPSFDVYAIFEDLEIDHSCISDGRFHIVTMTILLLGNLNDKRAIPSLLKVLNIRNALSYRNEEFSYYFDEFITVALEVLNGLADESALPELYKIYHSENEEWADDTEKVIDHIIEVDSKDQLWVYLKNRLFAINYVDGFQYMTNSESESILFDVLNQDFVSNESLIETLNVYFDSLDTKLVIQVLDILVKQKVPKSIVIEFIVDNLGHSNIDIRNQCLTLITPRLGEHAFLYIKSQLNNTAEWNLINGIPVLKLNLIMAIAILGRATLWGGATSEHQLEETLNVLFNSLNSNNPNEVGVATYCLRYSVHIPTVFDKFQDLVNDERVSFNPNPKSGEKKFKTIGEIAMDALNKSGR